MVYVSVLPQKYLLDQIAGNSLDIEVLVQAGHNPHSYDPSAKQVAQLSKAQMLMTTGVPFERAWLPRLTALYPRLLVVDTVAAIPKPEHTEEKLEHKTEKAQAEHHGHDHSHDGLDPHVWMSPVMALIQAETMLNALNQQFPEQKAVFNQGFAKLKTQLTQLDQQIHHDLAPYDGRSFMVFHPAWGYFAQQYHLEQLSIEFEGKSPSARKLVELSEQAKAEKIKVILVQSQFNQRPAERIASHIGAEVIHADPLPYDLPAALTQLTGQLLESWR
ncbi:hypothetical protein BTE48_08090 [Oceanospirillum multiglobuliferum]|uniref:High-affinity zinc uptake system protein ZnuA n=1 Tax=Oceanospirillum multiglobuliferum TaxID=64969 RepID=A0A1V4T4V2_9GAMM|nr:hypothetical protein BTE48_08090 [Oceanospirillum multiglobuliferum]